jgi:hypothetical protein
VSNHDPYDSLVPVFLRTNENENLEQVATAIFVVIQGEPFLFTAAHVTDMTKLGELLVPTESGFSPIDGYMAYVDLPPEMPRKNDYIDIAYYRLSTEFASELASLFRPIGKGKSSLIKSAHEYMVYSASGYPATKAKTNGEALTSEIFSFRGSVANRDVYKALDLSPETSIIIHFRKKYAVDNIEFRSTNPPGLRGISGGGIFAWPIGCELLNDWSLPTLVGVMHTYRERDGLIIGSTLLPVIGAITLGRMKKFGGVK